MKKLLLTIICSLLAIFTFAQETPQQQTVIKDKVVEASCGTCNFGLTGKKCELAVKIDGKAYFVDGTSIKDHGDEHGKDGFCNASKKAKVSGSIVDGRFNATSFALVKPEKKSKKRN